MVSQRTSSRAGPAWAHPVLWLCHPLPGDRQAGNPGALLIPEGGVRPGKDCIFLGWHPVAMMPAPSPGRCPPPAWDPSPHLKSHLWSSSGVLADNKDMTMDLPVPWRPRTPTTSTSV